MVFSRVIGKQLQGNFPGTISRGGDQLVEPHTNLVEIPFGAALKLVAGNWELVTTGDAETDAVAVAVRNVEQSITFANQTDNNSYPANKDADGLTRGFISVEVADGTPAVGGQVYLINAPGTTGLNPGDYVTTSNGGGDATTLAPAGWIFRTAKDAANNTAEIHILTARI